MRPSRADTLVRLERAGQPRPAEAAIALADQELRRADAAGLLQPAAYDLGQRLDVALDRPEAPAQLLAWPREAAVASADRIDEDQVGEVEPGLGVRQDLRGCGGQGRVTRHGQPPGTEGAQVQPGGTRAGATVQDEGHRSLVGRLFRLQLVVDHRDVGLRLPLRVGKADAAGRRGEAERAVGQFQHMPGRHVGRQAPLGPVRLWSGRGGAISTPRLGYGTRVWHRRVLREGGNGQAG